MGRLRRLAAAYAAYAASTDAVTLVVLCVVSGALILLVPTPPEGAEQALPDWLLRAWAAVLLTGGLARLVGLLAGRGRLDAIGCFLLGVPAIVYGLVLAVATVATGQAGPELAWVGVTWIFGVGLLVRWWGYWTAGRRPKAGPGVGR